MVLLLLLWQLFFLGMNKYYLFLTLLLLFGECYQKNGTNLDVEDSVEVAFNYATHIKISKSSDGYYATIRNPWDTTKTLHKYFLTDKDSANADGCTVIHTPVDNALIFTSLHAGLVKTLGCKNAIKSLCDVEYVLDKEILDDVKSGKIKDLGSSMNPDIENILLQNPDIIMLSPYETSGGFGLLDKTDIPLVECADYMENSPLGQAEWIKFYGLIFNKLETADSIFAEVEKNYLSLKSLVDDLPTKPSLLANSLTGAQWYMATGNSTAGRFYADAGFNFLFNYLDTYGTVPLNFETVFAKAYNADYWIVKYNRDKDYDLQSFAAEHPNYKDFKAFKDRNIYFCNLSYIPYYDETPFRPDLLLKDLIKISHPELLQDYSLRYFTKVQ